MVCVNLKMSVTVFLSVVIYIRNDKVCIRMAVMQNEKGCAPEEKGSVCVCVRERVRDEERESKSSDTEWGALRCGERIIQNPEYE